MICGSSKFVKPFLRVGRWVATLARMIQSRLAGSLGWGVVAYAAFFFVLLVIIVVMAFGAIVFGSALTMKVQYYLLDEQGFARALRLGLADMRLMPKPKAA